MIPYGTEMLWLIYKEGIKAHFHFNQIKFARERERERERERDSLNYFF